MKDYNKHLSKLLSYTLRHHPEHIGITLDKNGWAVVNDLLQRLNTAGHMIDRVLLEEIVATNSKKRFAFNDDQTMIRASQGHSIEIDLGIETGEPPALLYHGTAAKNRESILAEGLQKRNRQHVHLSDSEQTATEVGRRHGQPLIFHVDAARMRKDGFVFYCSENKVWLTDEIPAAYLSIPS